MTDSLLSSSARRTLVAVTRAAFPHDTFPDGPYLRAADEVVGAAAQDPRLLAQLVQGLDDLDRAREVPFTELPLDIAQTVLRGIQRTPFFLSIVDVVIVKLYDDHEVWDVLGYEGESFSKGGYLDRGFNDLDWLPDPRIEEVSS